MIYPVILAGGKGTRLWPLSTVDAPKQVQAFGQKKTLLQATYSRLSNGFAKENIFVISGVNIAKDVLAQIDIASSNLLLEPMAQDTAMAIGLAAVHILAKDREGVLLISSSDAFILEEEKYLQVVKTSAEYVAKHPENFMLLGIKPLYPEVGYGYIHKEKISKLKLAEQEIFKVLAFKEKPDLQTAEKYLADEDYLWNPAMFIFSAQQLLQWYQEFLPEIYQALVKIQTALQSFDADNYQAVLAQVYQNTQGISIDYGLLEKLDHMLVVPVDLTWADIGHWRALKNVRLLQENTANVSNVLHIGLDSCDNLLYSSSGKLIATIGVKDMILVETDKVILLCQGSQAQDLKKLLQQLKEKGLEEYL